MPELDLNRLQTVRHITGELCRHHFASILRFAKDQPAIRTGDGSRGFGEFSVDVERPSSPDASFHLLTSVKCLESLLSCPVELAPADAQALATTFSRPVLRGILQRTLKSHPFRLSRALPLLVELSGPMTRTRFTRYREVVTEACESIDEQLIPITRLQRKQITRSMDSQRPSSYNIYWVLQLLDDKRLAHSGLLRRARGSILRLLMEQLGIEVALPAIGSVLKDTDQLAWSLAAHLSRPGDLIDRGLGEELIRAGLYYLFKAQLPNGNWPQGRPVFHTHEVGNVYVFPLEAIAMIISAALRPESGYLRKLMEPYFEPLELSLEYIQSTRLRFSDKADILAWASGQRHDRVVPEAWATACTFEYIEYLRQLSGVLAAERSLTRRGVAWVGRDTSEAALDTLVRRGTSWTSTHDPTVADHLLSLFVYPTLVGNEVLATEKLVDLDRPAFPATQARSAILFGPPGSSKTTLARCVADLVGWPYVEIRASDFVSAGVAEIAKTADTIFFELMSLSRCVVLFDEIDELVRTRVGGNEFFGRFLTTSMLPKLADLWKQARIMFFVATNHLGYFDDAITRSERFDATIFVPPPSLAARLTRLKELVHPLAVSSGLREPTWDDSLSIDPFEEHLQAAAERSKDDTEEGVAVPRPWIRLAKLPLLRWDQLPELAAEIARELGRSNSVIGEHIIGAALGKVRDERLDKLDAYRAFVDDRRRERFDLQRFRCWSLPDSSPTILETLRVRYPGTIVKLNASGKLHYYFRTNDPMRTPIHAWGYEFSRTAVPGAVQCIRIKR